MKRILYIHHATGWGGAPINMINIINSLDSTKYSVEVLLIKKSIVAEKLAENGIPYSVAKSIFYRKYYRYFKHSEAGYLKWYQIYQFLVLSIIWLLSRFYFAKKELKSFEYDIAHLNSSVLTDWMAPAKKYGKVIIHIQEPFRKGILDFLHAFFTYQMRKHANRIIAISHDNAKRIDIPGSTTVIYNYAFIPQSSPQICSYSSKKVIYLGGSAKIKGFYTLVESLKYLDKDIKVLFAGFYASDNKSNSIIKNIVKCITGYGRKKQKAIQSMRNASNTIELGLVQNVDKYLDEVSCLVSPFSTPHFARPIIEANLHKKPAIGSDVQGMEEIIEHNVTGLLFKNGNSKSLAKAINYLTNNAQIAQKMGKKSYALAVKKYSPKNIMQFEEIYRNILS